MSITRHCFIAALIVVAGVSTAAAGTVAGTITGANTVVWLEGNLPVRAGATAITVSQRGVKFSPGFVVVMAGQTVEMPNDDNVAHNVYSLSPTNKFNLGVYAKGEKRTVVFDTPGVVEMKCWLHRRMSATVVVVPNAHYALGVDGAFSIPGVPAGTYKLIAWRDGTTWSGTVTVPATGTVQAQIPVAP